MAEKDLYCPKCREYPDRIKEVYQGPIVEIRRWNGECYELEASNINEAEYAQLCGKCDGKLVEKPSAEPGLSKQAGQ